MDLSDPTLPVPSMDALRNLFGHAKQMGHGEQGNQK